MQEYDIDKVDLMKIDIETAEKYVFNGDTSFLNLTKNLVIELHDWHLPGCVQSFFKAVSNYSYEYCINIENTILKNINS